ncbi:hypothetical protein BH24ACT3_BH24ACT3_11930 [soil metagenome]
MVASRIRWGSGHAWPLGGDVFVEVQGAAGRSQAGDRHLTSTRPGTTSGLGAEAVRWPETLARRRGACISSGLGLETSRRGDPAGLAVVVDPGCSPSAGGRAAIGVVGRWLEVHRAGAVGVLGSDGVRAVGKRRALAARGPCHVALLVRQRKGRSPRRDRWTSSQRGQCRRFRLLPWEYPGSNAPGNPHGRRWTLMDKSPGQMGWSRIPVDVCERPKTLLWSWRESNPRPRSGHRPCYDRSRGCGSTVATSPGRPGLRPPPGLSPR